ncbi:MAG: DUF2306 domain-containing protein [Pseudomonadota bacterium]
MRIHKWTLINLGCVALLVCAAVPFAMHAITRGSALGSAEEQASSRLFQDGAGLSNLSIYAHMVTGGIITVFTPFQLLAVVRKKWPRLHRMSGYVVAGTALVTGIAGLMYILLQGTVGGPLMSFAFALYGALMVLCACQTVVLARARHPDHRLWAERLVILALASWFYRVHYGLWFSTVGGIGVEPDFSGWFDRIQVFAFYVPYLAVHEIIWRWRKRGDAALA